MTTSTASMELDIYDARCDLGDAVKAKAKAKAKAELDQSGKLLQGSIVNANARFDENESSEKRLQVENRGLSR